MNQFFQIIDRQKQEDNWTVDILLNQEHAVFSGHFPEKPVVPGVCMLEVIKQTVSSITNVNLRYDSIADCKFVALILPESDHNLQLRLTIDQLDESSRFQVKCNVLSAGMVKLKLKSIMIES